LGTPRITVRKDTGPISAYTGSNAAHKNRHEHQEGQYGLGCGPGAGNAVGSDGCTNRHLKLNSPAWATPGLPGAHWESWSHRSSQEAQLFRAQTPLSLFPEKRLQILRAR
jgi:hypothetical protein